MAKSVKAVREFKERIIIIQCTHMYKKCHNKLLIMRKLKEENLQIF